MLPSQNSKNALLDYIIANRLALKIGKIKSLIITPGVNIDAQDSSGRTSLHFLVSGGGTFEYARLLIANGAQVEIANQDSDTPLHIVARRRNQEQLLFLLLAKYYNSNAELPKNLLDNEQILSIFSLFNYGFDEQNQFGRIFKKLIANYFDFKQLTSEEIDFLEKIRDLNSREKSFADFGVGNNKDLIDNCKKFISNFACLIKKQHEQEIVLPYEKSQLGRMLGITLGEVLPDDVKGIIAGDFKKMEELQHANYILLCANSKPGTSVKKPAVHLMMPTCLNK